MSVTVKKVAVLSPGDMGGATGGQLHNNGLEVYTCLDGRSALTRQIATEAGFVDTPNLDELMKSVDLVLSILVPSQAVGLAESVAAAMKRTGATPVYADCNAIAPQTVEKIAGIIADAGAQFIDAGIIGGPPTPKMDTTFYCSGPDTAAFEELGKHGLTVKVVGPKIGQASGLKMVYAASTKGTTALWTELMVAARAMGLEESLMAEFGDNHPIVARNLRSIPGMAHKAGRWVGEMEEIAATFEGLGMTPKILEGAADMYRFVNATPLGALTSRDPHPALDEVFDTLVANRDE
jgi:3-hydroxyisobutyrate dehydrogenase-like beta-hydroxyacid dehydrogenase